jgi:photosystem II biogenesis protein Psp29
MVEMHLLSVNADFTYNSIYALGVVTTFDRFMQGYQPEQDLAPIFNAIIQAVEQDPPRYRQDAARLKALAQSLPAKDLIAGISQTTPLYQDADLQAQLQAIAQSAASNNNAQNSNFKYSRLFAIGLFSLLELADAELVKDDNQRNEALKTIAEGLNLSLDKLNKDLELYRSNLDKMTQALIVMEDMLAADRKKRDQRQKQSSTPVAPPSTNE